MMFARTVSSLGTVTFAAHQIGLSICGLTFSPSMAFGVAGTTLVDKVLEQMTRNGLKGMPISYIIWLLQLPALWD